MSRSPGDELFLSLLLANGLLGIISYTCFVALSQSKVWFTSARALLVFECREYLGFYAGHGHGFVSFCRGFHRLGFV